MNAGILPIALLFLALALSLSFTALRPAIGGAVAAIVAALLASTLTIAQGSLVWVFAGLWISVVATVGLTYLWHRLPAQFTLVAGLNAGAWAGMLAAVSSLRTPMISAFAILLLLFVGHWLVGRGYGIALKVVGSWVVAVSILAIFVSFTPTPGYKPDHME